MNKIILIFLLGSTILFSQSYKGSTTAAVTLAGAILKNQHKDTDTKKYKRKDCPVCKGKGWYMSGDGIKKIDCQYCEPDSNTSDQNLPEAPAMEVTPNQAPVADNSAQPVIVKPAPVFRNHR